MLKYILYFSIFLFFSCSNAITGRGSARSSKAGGSPSRSLSQIRSERDGAHSSSLVGLGKMEFSSLETQYITTPTMFKGQVFEPLTINLRNEQRKFHYPAKGHLLSPYGQRSGRMHTGVDIKAMTGDGIFAAFDGVVRMSKNYSSYGNVVVIRHYNGLETVYAHNTKNLVVPGQRVRAGKMIALAGSTGRSTGSHLHFEVRAHGQTIDPALVIDCAKQKIQPKMVYVVMVEDGKIVGSNKPIRGLSAGQQITESQKRGAIFNSGGSHHTVVGGDTLWSISQRYKTTVEKICRLNKIKKSTPLIIGAKLKIK